MAKGTSELTPPEAPPAGTGKGAANRQKIVDAALNLFMERGYAETSIGDIAEHAGLLKGNLSYYFKTKAEMLESVSDARMEELFGRLKALLPADASALVSIRAFIQVTQDSAHELARVGCPVGTLASQLGKTDPALQPYASRILEALQAWLVGQFARELPAAKARQHAEFLLTLLQGAAVMAHAFRDPALIDRQARQAKAWLADVLASPH
ncbi:MAG: TetR/AcrR family transcriptional regulator [Ramlibacter sp.]|nr:TetR/AcrR family transcriptional regulator [Ramlibacter sp.]MBX3660630.1 TetR/AcrR family transcriptional regulator [Ramlibacter sp.]MCW5648173.1 TetR/AcrR family transcriptional regulator [Ramlibacter sp.]